MLEKPALDEAVLSQTLAQAYGLLVVRIEFLPLGAAQYTAVYRVTGGDGACYFLKLRSEAFDETSVILPHFFIQQGIRHIIPPRTTRAGQLWANLENYRAIVYPYIQGQDGYAVPLNDAHWIELGRTLRQIHRLALPEEIKARIPCETYPGQWRASLKALLEDETCWILADQPAKKAAALLRARRDETLWLVQRAEALAQALQARPAQRVLCHTDLHAGNILVDSCGEFFIVDWDAPLLALKERDLMYPGGAQGFLGHTPEEEERQFFQGYGQVKVDREALAYYRCERIVQDIAIFGEQLLLSAEGGADREPACGYLASNFLPGGTLAMARRADRLCQ